MTLIEQLEHYGAIAAQAALAMAMISVPVGIVGHTLAALPWGWAKWLGGLLESVGTNLKGVAGSMKPAAKDKPAEEAKP